MEPFSKSDTRLVKMTSSIITAVTLAAAFVTPVWADRDGDRDAKRYEGGQVERPQNKKIERREVMRIEQQQERRIDRVEKRKPRQIHSAPVWRGDIRHFERHDLPVWRGGSWHHRRHNGELAWWWVVGGMWYLYPQPVYPYPDPYMPPVVAIQSAPVEAAPSIVVAPAVASQSWYFCESANGYYPYTASCPEGWKTVPATPAIPSPAPAQ